MNKRRLRRPALRNGMTLVEIMVALAMFGIAFGSIFGMARMMYRTSLTNLADGVALHAAEGIVEQMRVLPYDSAGTTIPGLTQLSASTATTPIGISLTYLDVPSTTYGIPQTKTQSDIIANGGYTTLKGASIAGDYKPGSGIKQAPLDLQVRVLVVPHPTDVNFGAGMTIEVYYRYRVYASDSYVVRVLRTFVPRGVT